MRKLITKTIGVIIVITLLFVLVACGGPTEGFVYAKDHIPEHIEYETVQDYIWTCQPNYDGKGCTMKQTWVGSHKEPYVEPECYWIGFEDQDGKRGEDCIGKTRWETIEVGDYYEKD